MKKLISNVNIEGTWYGPGYPKNTVTPEIAKSITNPKVWGDATEDDDEDESLEPPRSGTGSGVKAWKAHAERLGLTVPENAKAEEIQALVDASKE